MISCRLRLMYPHERTWHKSPKSSRKSLADLSLMTTTRVMCRSMTMYARLSNRCLGGYLKVRKIVGARLKCVVHDFTSCRRSRCRNPVPSPRVPRRHCAAETHIYLTKRSLCYAYPAGSTSRTSRKFFGRSKTLALRLVQINGRDDVLRVILTELDGVPNLGNDELKDARDRAITLELTNRFANVRGKSRESFSSNLSTNERWLDPQAEEKAL